MAGWVQIAFGALLAALALAMRRAGLATRAMPGGESKFARYKGWEFRVGIPVIFGVVSVLLLVAGLAKLA
jgi:hypothetical protein